MIMYLSLQKLHIEANLLLCKITENLQDMISDVFVDSNPLGYSVVRIRIHTYIDDYRT
jgi:hypothetical protein